LKVGEVDFKIFSTLQIDTETLHCTVFLVESYGEPLIIDDCKRILTSLSLTISQFTPSPDGIDATAELVQAFYEKCAADYSECVRCDSGFMEEVEARLVGRLLPGVYEEARVQDRVLLDKMAGLEGLAEEGEDAVAEMLDEATLAHAKDLLHSMKVAKLPKAKLDILLSFVQTICDNLNSRQSLPNADTLLPALLLATIKSRPQHLISDLLYIQRFRNHATLSGQVAYNLTNVMAVVRLIETAQVDRVGEGGESIYSLVSRSTSHLQQHVEDTKKVEEKEDMPHSPSMLMRPLTEINAMASSVFTKVTFYPPSHLNSRRRHFPSLPYHRRHIHPSKSTPIWLQMGGTPAQASRYRNAHGGGGRGDQGVQASGHGIAPFR